MWAWFLREASEELVFEPGDLVELPGDEGELVDQDAQHRGVGVELLDELLAEDLVGWVLEEVGRRGGGGEVVLAGVLGGAGFAGGGAGAGGSAVRVGGSLSVVERARVLVVDSFGKAMLHMLSPFGLECRDANIPLTVGQGKSFVVLVFFCGSGWAKIATTQASSGARV